MKAEFGPFNAGQFDSPPPDCTHTLPLAFTPSGMGFASMSRSGGVSHSVLNDSEDIQQDIPLGAKESRFSKSFSKR
jgi:hypothetical protein